MIDERPIYSTYALLDPRKPGSFVYSALGKTISLDDEPFYYGCTKNVKSRKTEHVIEANSFRRGGIVMNPEKSIVINEIFYDDLDFMFVITEKDLLRDDALKLEDAFVRAIGVRDFNCGPLTNQFRTYGNRMTITEEQLTKWKNIVTPSEKEKQELKKKKEEERRREEEEKEAIYERAAEAIRKLWNDPDSLMDIYTWRRQNLLDKGKPFDMYEISSLTEIRKRIEELQSESVCCV